MKSFKEFLVESIFRVDNPRGNWLANKQEDAEQHIKKGKSGITGAVTGYFTKPLLLPVSRLISIPGERGEEEYRKSGVKQQELEKQIQNPANFDSQRNPILIGVNHKGHPYVIEGNHRLAYAHNNGISHIHAEVRYFNGGEEADGPMHPKTLTPES